MLPCTSPRPMLHSRGIYSTIDDHVFHLKPPPHPLSLYAVWRQGPGAAAGPGEGALVLLSLDRLPWALVVAAKMQAPWAACWLMRRSVCVSR